MLSSEDIEKKLEETFTDGEIRAQDLTGGGDHWQVTIKSDKFQGLTMVEQHQLVYATLGDWMSGAIHALAITAETKTKP